MVTFAKGDIVVVPFPFSQASGEKLRPALVLASWPCLKTTDYLLCLISAQNVAEPHIMPLDSADVENGSLNRASFLRPTYLFTIAQSRISQKIGTLKRKRLDEALEVIKTVLSS